MGQVSKRKKFRKYFSSDVFLAWVKDSCPPLVEHHQDLSKMLSYLEQQCSSDPEHDHTVCLERQGFRLALGMNMLTLTPWLSMSLGDLLFVSDCPVSMNDFLNEEF